MLLFFLLSIAMSLPTGSLSTVLYLPLTPGTTPRYLYFLGSLPGNYTVHLQDQNGYVAYVGEMLEDAPKKLMVPYILGHLSSHGHRHINFPIWKSVIITPDPPIVQLQIVRSPNVSPTCPGFSNYATGIGGITGQVEALRVRLDTFPVAPAMENSVILDEIGDDWQTGGRLHPSYQHFWLHPDDPQLDTGTRLWLRNLGPGLKPINRLRIGNSIHTFTILGYVQSAFPNTYKDYLSDAGNLAYQLHTPSFTVAPRQIQLFYLIDPSDTADPWTSLPISIVPIGQRESTVYPVYFSVVKVWQNPNGWRHVQAIVDFPIPYGHLAGLIFHPLPGQQRAVRVWLSVEVACNYPPLISVSRANPGVLEVPRFGVPERFSPLSIAYLSCGLGPHYSIYSDGSLKTHGFHIILPMDMNSHHWPLNHILTPSLAMGTGCIYYPANYQIGIGGIVTSLCSDHLSTCAAKLNASAATANGLSMALQQAIANTQNLTNAVTRCYETRNTEEAMGYLTPLEKSLYRTLGVAMNRSVHYNDRLEQCETALRATFDQVKSECATETEPTPTPAPPVLVQPDDMDLRTTYLNVSKYRCRASCVVPTIPTNESMDTTTTTTNETMTMTNETMTTMTNETTTTTTMMGDGNGVLVVKSGVPFCLVPNWGTVPYPINTEEDLSILVSVAVAMRSSANITSFGSCQNVCVNGDAPCASWFVLEGQFAMETDEHGCHSSDALPSGMINLQETIPIHRYTMSTTGCELI